MTSKKQMWLAFAMAIVVIPQMTIARPRSDSEHPMIGNAGDRYAVEGEQRQVEIHYSTKPRRVFIADREYVVPANYLGPKQGNEPDELRTGNSGFGFSLFLPDFSGYTTDNWRDPFDRRRIDIVRVAKVNTRELIRMPDGTHRRVKPSAYGDPSARFANRRSRLEDAPSFHMFGLEGYRRRGPSPEVVWTGRRSNGEFFFLECAVPQSDLGRPGAVVVNPSCQTQYYSAAEDLHIVYRYSQHHLPQWREIDDAIWAKLHKWEVELKSQNLVIDGTQYALQAGMQVSGEINLGTRSILDYVLSPVQKAWHEAGRER